MHRPARPGALIGAFFAISLLVSTTALAQVPRDAKTLDCDSATFRSLVNAPVRDVREDLAVTLYALKQFEFITSNSKGNGCLGQPEARYSPVPLLLGYLENRWISESLGEPIEPVATVLDALRQEMRRQEAVSSPETDPEFETRRELGLQHSLVVEVADQSLLPDDIRINLRNTSSWTIHLHPHRAGSSGYALPLWFEPSPEGAPVKFQCRDTIPAGIDEVASGQQVSLTCHNYAMTSGQSSGSPVTSDSKGRWTVHPAEKIGWPSSISALDVSVSSRQVLERAQALVAGSTCSDRGSCAMEKEIRNRGRNPLPIGLVLAVVVALVLGFSLPRVAAYVVGPAFLALAGVFVIFGYKLFFPFQTEGSPAGLIVPAVAWVVVIVCCGLGITLIVTGRARIKRKTVARSM
jgi:hypothetical protein